MNNSADGQKRLMAESVGLDSEVYITRPIKNHEFEVGDKVTYNAISLWSKKGVIKSIGKTPKGGDCIVKWTEGTAFGNIVVVEECMCNLIGR